jgi:hypothetical protein
MKRECLICGTEFYPRTTWQFYCSTEHQQFAKRKRNRAAGVRKELGLPAIASAPMIVEAEEGL